MHHLLIYDITEDKIRNRVAETCKDYGLVRVQYSSFYGRLPRTRLRDLERAMVRLLRQGQGNVIIVPVCEACRAGIVKLESEAL